MLPVDEASKNAGLKDYLSQLRRGRGNEAFNLWLQAEANRELRNTPVFDELRAASQRPVQSVSAAVKLSSPATREFWEIPVLQRTNTCSRWTSPPGC